MGLFSSCVPAGGSRRYTSFPFTACKSGYVPPLGGSTTERASNRSRSMSMFAGGAGFSSAFLSSFFSSFFQPVGTLVDVGHLPRRIVVHADAHGLIDERELLAVGRPVRRIAEARAERRDLALGARPVGRPEGQLVFAAAVAPVRDGFAVGRPAWKPIGDAGCARHVDRRAVLRGKRDDVATRLERHAPSR